MLSSRPLVLDACVVINLVASGQIETIAAAAAPRRLLAEAAAAESLRFADGEALDLAPLFQAGVLERCPLANEGEQALFVAYAAELGDGEAMSLAMAQARGFALATDDGKALRVARARVPGIALFTTPELVRHWAKNRTATEIAAVLGAIEARARYAPAARHPLARWWRQHTGR